MMEERSVRADEDAIDLRELFAALSSRRWWILASALICTSLAAAYVSFAVPVYRSSTIFTPAAADEGLNLGPALGQLGGIAALAGIGGGYGVQTEEALAVLRSRDFTERFLREEGVLPLLYPKLWDPAKEEWRVSVDHQPTYARAYRRFHAGIRRIDQDKKTGLITLSVDWHDRDKAAEWANKLVARVNAEMRSRTVAKTGTALGFLERELRATVPVETRAAISRLIESQVRQRMLANVTEEFAFRVVDRALPSDANDPVRPKKVALIAIGFMAGVILGLVLALWRAWRR